MEIKKIVNLLEAQVDNPSVGLQDELFLFISKITPLVNVDLLIKNKNNQTLLTWREDGLYPPGWHIPGGIVRYKEKMFDRIIAVAASELGVKIRYNKTPLAMNECIQPRRRVRGHFISFLYECKIIGQLDAKLRYKSGAPKPGEWAWHSNCPKDIIPVHGEMYRQYL
ncbi:MAG: NUDIX hydrolase [Candidatus Margulisiibacteriota bacterium]